MTLLLFGLAVVAFVVPAVRPTVAATSRPSWFVTLDSLALGLGLLALVLGLGLASVVGAVHLAAGTSLVRYEGHLAPGGIAASAVSMALLVVLAFRLAMAVRRSRSGRRAAYADGWLGVHRHGGDHDLVVLPTAAPVAYSVHGSPPQVVISQGLRDRLGEDDLLGFVIDHERAHLRRRHHRAVLLAAAVDALLGRVPVVARSTTALRLAVERAADEEAAGTDPHRRRQGAMALARMAHVQPGPAGTANVALFRAGGLVAASTSRGVTFGVVAIGGLVVLAALTTAVAGHAGTELPALMAVLR